MLKLASTRNVKSGGVVSSEAQDTVADAREMGEQFDAAFRQAIRLCRKK